jgi:hypothetical protein
VPVGVGVPDTLALGVALGDCVGVGVALLLGVPAAV